MSQGTWIYLIRDNHTGFVKIGKSINPYKRISNLKRQPTLLPYEHNFELIEAWYGCDSDETELHKIFKTKRIRGEWFALTTDDIKDIKYHFYNLTQLSTRVSQREEQEPMFYEYNHADYLDFLVEGCEVYI